MRILLDENLPRKLVAALRAEGHAVESVYTLRLHGLENGKLYEFARDSFDLCFTRDAGFANNVRQDAQPSRLKLLRVTMQQKPQDEFVLDFISVFRTSDWSQFHHGDDLAIIRLVSGKTPCQRRNHDNHACRAGFHS